MFREGRADGRGWNQLRPASCEQGILSQADGSARLKNGDTAIIVAVYGPKAPRLAQELPDRASVSVAVKPKTGVPGPREREMELALRQCFEGAILTVLHPQTNILLVVQVLHDDGGLFSACVNATSLALVDAGVALQMQLAAVSCAVTSTGDILIDPTAREEESSSCIVQAAFLPSSTSDPEPDLPKIGYFRTFGVLAPQKLDELAYVCFKASQIALAFMETVSRKRIGV